MVKNILILIVVSLLLMYVLHDADKRYEVDQKVIAASDSVRSRNIIDSLNNEIFILQTINGRYEMALEYLKEQDSVSAKIVFDYMNNQTE